MDSQNKRETLWCTKLIRSQYTVVRRYQESAFHSELGCVIEVIQSANWRFWKHWVPCSGLFGQRSLPCIKMQTIVKTMTTLANTNQIIPRCFFTSFYANFLASSLWRQTIGNLANKSLTPIAFAKISPISVSRHFVSVPTSIMVKLIQCFNGITFYRYLSLDIQVHSASHAVEKVYWRDMHRWRVHIPLRPF